MASQIPISAILKPYEYNPEGVERISHRPFQLKFDIVPYDPSWPEHFSLFKKRIVDALGPPQDDKTSQSTTSSADSSSTQQLLSVAHTGSTSVPSMPAKDVIDIDIVVKDVAAEHLYVPALEAQGFQFLLREPSWHGHRFFIASEPIPANVHVWGPACPEAERHRILRDWLRENEQDRELYAATKMECIKASAGKGESMMDYTTRKNAVIGDMLTRAFKSLGFLEDSQ